MEATEVLLHPVPVHNETVRVPIAQLVRQTVPLQLCLRLHLLVNPATQDICHCLLATNSTRIAIVIARETSYYNNGTVTSATKNIRSYLVGIERNLLLIRTCIIRNIRLNKCEYSNYWKMIRHTLCTQESQRFLCILFCFKGNCQCRC